jgi:hypothetical protein
MTVDNSKYSLPLGKPCTRYPWLRIVTNRFQKSTISRVFFYASQRNYLKKYFLWWLRTLRLFPSGEVKIRGDFLEELSHDLARVCFPD